MNPLALLSLTAAALAAEVPLTYPAAHRDPLVETLHGTPVADPFVIACAKIRQGTVVTEERLKPHAAKIPNVCQHPGVSVPCIDLEDFMQKQGWSF